MKLLVIGGTRFVGWHLAELALARGHEVTLFNRGSAAGPAGTQALRGDRQSDLAVLAGHDWDAVVDTCAYRPQEVARMAEALAPSVGRYLLVSTVSVYASFAAPNVEGSALATMGEVEPELVDGRSYGPLKVLCERALAARLAAARCTIVRPGLVVGPRDPTQRFTYWPARIARAAAGEPVLLPGGPDEGLQFIDVRDLAAFMLGLVEQGRHGVFNASSRPGAATMGGLWSACCAAAGTRPRAVWADAAAVARLGLQPWTDLPVWLPAQGESAGFSATDVSAALAAGLHTRPLLQTVSDTLAWWRGLAPAQQAITQAGLAPAREAAALEALG